MLRRGKVGNLGAVMGRPLPAEWVPDDALREKVSADFGMTVENVNAELPSSLTHQSGSASGTLLPLFYKGGEPVFNLSPTLLSARRLARYGAF
jgi:hypothetical protein